jgi:hypothetical protein
VTSGSGRIQSRGGTLESVANEGIFEVTNGGDVRLCGTIENTGTILLNSTGNGTHLYADDSEGVTLTGGGTVVMSDSIHNCVSDPDGGDGRLVNEDNTIQGAGTIGADHLAVINRGLIDANAGNPLSLVSVPPEYERNFVNSGTLRASAGGTLQILGGIYINYEDATLGVIEALDGSVVVMDESWIKGGRLVTSGSGRIQSNARPSFSIAKLDSLANEGIFEVTNGHTACLRGTIENTGTILVNSVGSDTYLYIDLAEGVRLTGGGIVAMSDNRKNCISDSYGAEGWLVNEDNTIRGAGRIGADSVAVTNRGLIDANGTNPLILDPRDADLDGAGADFFNDAGGVLRASGAGGMALNGGVYRNLGTIEAMDGSAVSYALDATTANNVAGVLTGGTWRVVATGHGATLTLRGDAITAIAAATEVVLSGSDAAARVGAIPIEDTLATNDGTLRVLDNRGFSAVNAFFNSPTGLLHFDGGTASFHDDLVNSGALWLGAGTSLLADGDVDLRGTASLVIELAGAQQDKYGRTDVVGTLSLDGALDARLIDGFAPTAGDIFDLLDWGQLADRFDTLLLPELDGRLAWNVDDLYTAGELSVVACVPGDANKDGRVNDQDTSILGSHWLQPGGATWTDGDFNDDQTVNDADAAILAAHWGDDRRGESVPEPGAVVLLVSLSLMTLLRWRR